jgi:hypothetical protein
MQLHLTLDIPRLPKPITYTDKILLVGSCFTEHMSERLGQHRFDVLSNPHGILFNPLSVADSLNSYIEDKQYTPDELFTLNELWNSWDHHTRFSHLNKEEAVKGINGSQESASEFIRSADWIMITLGSAFQYYLKESGKPVANNHRAPAQWFEKRLLSIDVITKALSNTLEKISAINPNANILFTISPVRHIRDGVVDNNRSKARLIESVHTLCEQYTQAHYFPAYELVIDILRDYRYYDIDFVHPNYLATTVVWEHFVNACIDADTKELMQQVQEIVIARNHRPRFPETEAHQKFKASYIEKIKGLQQRYPFLKLDDELNYFSS